MSDRQQQATRPSWRFNFNTAAALFFIAFGVGLLMLIPTQVEQPPMIFGQRMIALDPALFPNIVAGAFIVVGALYLYNSLTLREHNDFRTTEQSALFSVAVSLLVMVAYAALMERLGFITTSVAVIFALGLFFGSRDYIRLGIIAVATPIGVYFIFSRLLQVYLPVMEWWE